MTEQKDEETRADSDLRDHLHQMEARLENYVMQEIITMSKQSDLQSKETQSKVSTKSTEKIRSIVSRSKGCAREMDVHKKRRDAIQAQIRDLIGQAKAQRGNRDDKKSAWNSTNYPAKSITWRKFETRGGMSSKKEKKPWRKSRTCERMKELEPEVEKLQLIKVDLSNRDAAAEAIRKSRS